MFFFLLYFHVAKEFTFRLIVNDVTNPVLNADLLYWNLKWNFKWITQFKRGHVTCPNEYHSDTLIEVIMPETVKRVHKFLLNDGLLKLGV